MKLKFLLFLTCVTLGYCLSIKNEAAEVTYVGAVIEYEPYNQWDDVEKGYGVIRQNALKINEYAAQAKSQLADILVAPEYGLQSLNMHSEDMDKFLTYTQYVPDPEENVIPYSMNISNSNFEGLQILSRGAMENAIYLVVDLGELYPCSDETVILAPWHIQSDANCPDNGYFFYNTQVVFDRTGALIARYRKQHLYGEAFYTPGPKNDTTALFLTDFDVLFTLQVCFDIAFEHPGYSNVLSLGVRDVAMSTAWVDYLPFNLADSTQNAWSRGIGTNLLVSGYHLPEKSKLGSGIYKAYSQELPVYTYDKDSENVLLVSQVRTVAASSITSVSKSRNHVRTPKQKLTHEYRENNSISKSKREGDNSRRLHVMIHENLSNFTSVILESGQVGVSQSAYVCSYDQFCCNLTYEYTGNLTYMFIAYSGLFSPGIDLAVGIQTCSVIWCKTNDINTCALVEAGLPADDTFGPFSIFSSSFAITSVFPGGNHRDLSLINNNDLQFDVSGKNFTLMTTQPISSPLVAALYGRWYARDGSS